MPGGNVFAPIFAHMNGHSEQSLHPASASSFERHEKQLDAFWYTSVYASKSTEST